MDNPRKINEARRIALEKHIIQSRDELQISKAKNKRFAIKVDGKTINFGLWPYTGKGTYIDHRDDKIRLAYRARHSKILKNGKPAYKDESSPEFYSWNILW